MTSLRAAIVASLALAAPGTAVGQAPAVPVGPDAFKSSNVEYLGSLKQDVGLTTGAKVLGDRMFVTSAKNISIYDISTPSAPEQVGLLKANASWENEEVPTNGEVLAFASDFFSVGNSGCGGGLATTGCIQFFDVRDPGNIRQVASLPSASHTIECALNCEYFYASSGSIIDARGILSGTPPKVVGNWKTAAAGQGTPQSSCHHIRELRPGVLMTACRPFAVISINAEDGGTPELPKVLASGKAAEFVHSARWPNEGTDDLVMIGGEQNFGGRCERNTSDFSTYSAKGVLAGTTKEFQGPIAQVQPPANGVYADGSAPAGALGCSVHWFMEHPSFEDGGLVALSEYEQGVRFLQIGQDGSIKEQGYFVSLAGSSSSPKWAGKDNVVYSIDYQRGIDILRWTGDTYVPGAAPDPNAAPGTEGKLPRMPAPSARARAQRAAAAAELSALGWNAGLCRLAAQD